MTDSSADRVAQLESLLRIDILPLAMGASCAYADHPDADTSQHCCDWSYVVEAICDVLGMDRP